MPGSQLLMVIQHADGRRQTILCVDHPADVRDCDDPSCACKAAPTPALDLPRLFVGVDGEPNGFLTTQELMLRAGRGWTPKGLANALQRLGCVGGRDRSGRGWRLPPGVKPLPGVAVDPVLRSIPRNPGEAKVRRKHRS